MSEKRDPAALRGDATTRRMGGAIKQIREEQGLTQKQVATRYGTTEGNIAAYEQGRNRFTAQDIPRLASALGVDVTYLSRRLGLCGDGSDALAILAEYAGPEIGGLVAQALAKYPTMTADQRIFFVEALRRV